ncbi:MAG: hypothetical protein RMJ07_04605 [Nitrososphaerota archaeon]|nr:hypothetical protein [Candidatus Bathyarchaeota archaeon]MDW8048945.1 hypothetical protein [Nitrososphaerota archaeon]
MRRRLEPEDEGKIYYLDLLISTLREHEKNLDNLIGRIENLASALDKIVDSLQAICAKLSK